MEIKSGKVEEGKAQQGHDVLKKTGFVKELIRKYNLFSVFQKLK